MYKYINIYQVISKKFMYFYKNKNKNYKKIKKHYKNIKILV